MTKSARKDVAVIIPVFNESTVIKKVINAVLNKYSTVICIDDGSTDASAREIERTSAVLIQHPINMGQGAALQTGIEYVRMLDHVKYVVTFDADGQHRLADVASMIKVLEDSSYDIALGSRFLEGKPDVNILKHILLKMGTRFTNAVTGLKLSDTHNGLRVFVKRVADEINLTASDMLHASEILEIVARKKYRYIEVPVKIEYTDYSRSKGQPMINAVNIVFDSIFRRLTR